MFKSPEPTANQYSMYSFLPMQFPQILPHAHTLSFLNIAWH